MNARAATPEAERELHVVEAPIELATVGLLHDAHHRVPPLRDFAVAEGKVADTGAISSANRRAPSSAKATVQAMGPEQAAFDALQGEDGQIGNDDDDAGEEDRLLHLVGGSGVGPIL